MPANHVFTDARLAGQSNPNMAQDWLGQEPGKRLIISGIVNLYRHYREEGPGAEGYIYVKKFPVCSKSQGDVSRICWTGFELGPCDDQS